MVSPISFEQSLPGRLTQDSGLTEDQFKAILCVEQSYRVPYISCRAVPSVGGSGGRGTSKENGVPYGEWRRKICQWSFKVIDHFKIDREVVSCALNILDRYLGRGQQSLDMDVCPCAECQRKVDSRTFQLTAMTSLYLAIKISDSGDDHNPSSRRLRLTSFVELSRGQFCPKDITQTERAILKELQWKVYPPTPMTFVSFLLRLMPSHESLPYNSRKSYDLVLHVLHELARYLSELSVCLGSISMAHTPSQVAYASILLSMELLTPIALPLDARTAFSEAVVSTSSLSGGTILTPNDEPIQCLQDNLRQSFWPEMLMDDCENAEVGHPISMAKSHGLLDASCMTAPHGIYGGGGDRTYSSTSSSMGQQQHLHALSPQQLSPTHVYGGSDKMDYEETSPVCVARQQL